MRSRWSLLVAIIVGTLGAHAAVATVVTDGPCKYYSDASEAIRPLPPDRPGVSCVLDAVVHSGFHHSSCTSADDRRHKNASAITTYVRCYDSSAGPARCLDTYIRERDVCTTGNAHPYPVILCIGPCSQGAEMRQRYFEALAVATLPSGYPFLTDVQIPAGRAIFDLFAALDGIQDQILAEGGPELAAKQAMVDLATLALYVADDSFHEGDEETGAAALLSATTLVDLLTDFIPGVSTAKDIVSLLTGFNPITGAELSDVDRALILGTLLLPGVVAGGGKALAKIGRTLGRLRSEERALGRTADALFHTLERSDSKLGRLVSDLPCP